MLVKDMNSRQKKAFYNIYHASNWLIGGLENALSDYPEDSEDYKEAEALLNDHDRLVTTLYEMATVNCYAEGSCWFDASWIREIRFCGKDWLMERCEKRITKEGY